MEIWRDLGQGDGLALRDPSWTAYTADEEYYVYLRSIEAADATGGFRAIFESQQGKTREAVAKEVQSILYHLRRTRPFVHNNRFGRSGKKLADLLRSAIGLNSGSSSGTSGLFKYDAARSHTYLTKDGKGPANEIDHWERYWIEDV